MNLWQQLTYTRCVHPFPQSGLYLAPIAIALSLRSPRRGFWKPLKTNVTPSINLSKGLEDFFFLDVSSLSEIKEQNNHYSQQYSSKEEGKLASWFMPLGFIHITLWKIGTVYSVLSRALRKKHYRYITRMGFEPTTFAVLEQCLTN